jgi:hypothetical protein
MMERKRDRERERVREKKGQENDVV